MDTQTWIINESQAGQRLDVFLTEQCAPLTRSSLRKWIEKGIVTVNKKEVSVHHFLKEGDQVIYQEKAEISAEKDTKLAVEPKIIAETADWLVIDKPTGLLVHPSAVSKGPTLVDWLIKHDPKIGRVGENPLRPGIIHRLDREVSGLMMVAKTQAAYEDLQNQFRRHEIKKHYLGLVHGEIIKEEDEIKLRIARSSTKARMAARPASEETGKAAWTHYRIKERFHGATLLDLEILSGRTHQIRAHMHGIGHPIIGDPLYKKRLPDRNFTAPRIMLQSVELSFVDPATGEQKTFSLPPDPSFDTVMKQFRSPLPLVNNFNAS